ncbi:Pectinesterase inhibitor, partial [Cucurbita argyrosperma subsp. sororia]
MLQFLVLFPLFSHVKPDAALIGSVCGKTEQPVICSDCFESSSGSQTADVRGLAVIAIGCAERNTRLMAQKLGELLRSTPDSALKTILNGCWISTGYAAGDFPGIARAVAAGDYTTGRNTLEIAIRNVNSCLEEFNKNPRVPVPSEVLTVTVTVAAIQGCRIVSDILNSI